MLKASSHTGLTTSLEWVTVVSNERAVFGFRPPWCWKPGASK